MPLFHVVHQEILDPHPPPSPGRIDTTPIEAIVARHEVARQLMDHDLEGSLPVVFASVKDIPTLLALIAAQQERLDECYREIVEAVNHHAPLGGGWTNRLSALLCRHGIEGARFSATSSKAG